MSSLGRPIRGGQRPAAPTSSYADNHGIGNDIMRHIDGSTNGNLYSSGSFFKESDIYRLSFFFCGFSLPSKKNVAYPIFRLFPTAIKLEIGKVAMAQLHSEADIE